MPSNDHVHPTFRQLLNEIATESVNGSSEPDRWECPGCGRRWSNRYQVAQCESAHDHEEGRE
jgi:hypothetical protein